MTTDDVSHVKHSILQHLPVFQYNEGGDDASDSQLINSVYLDNSSLELYHGRLDKRPNALALRIRCSCLCTPVSACHGMGWGWDYRPLLAWGDVVLAEAADEPGHSLFTLADSLWFHGSDSSAGARLHPSSGRVDHGSSTIRRSALPVMQSRFVQAQCFKRTALCFKLSRLPCPMPE